MKKLILVIAALALIASPAMAVDWNFYGSARMATFYNSRDFNNAGASDLDSGGGFLKANEDSDDQIRWDLQGNSRLGATVKAENISGRVELGINESSATSSAVKGPGTGAGGHPSSDNTDTVTSRRIYGIWDFGAGKLKVGKDYTPVKQFTSGQAFDADAGLLGNGTAYGGRNGQISLAFGGFEIAAITNQGGRIGGMSTGDVDLYLPRLEAEYGMSFDTWNFKVIGGYQSYTIENAGLTFEDVDVVSWILGADVGFNFGPAYVKAGGSFGTNWSDAGWSGAEAGATYDGDDDTDDVDTIMAHLVGGFKFTDMLTLEGGVGYRESSSDVKGVNDADVWAYYVQGVVSLAPGVWMIPEAGYYNFGDVFAVDGKDGGDQFYLGAKWQIDF
jgi:hypothetical protein